MTRNSLVLGGVMLLLVGALAIWATRPASPVATTPIASASALASVSPAGAPTPSPTAATAPGTFENRILGYRITLPVAYRLLGSAINAGQLEQLGSDAFSVSTVAEQRADCLSDAGGGIGSALKGELVNVAVIGNVRGLSVVEWATDSPWGRLHTVEAVTVGGYEAARLIQQGIAERMSRSS